MDKFKKYAMKFAVSTLALLALLTSVNYQGISFFAAEIASNQQTPSDSEQTLEEDTTIEHTPNVDVPEPEQKQVTDEEANNIVNQQVEQPVVSAEVEQTIETPKQIPSKTREEQLVEAGYTEDITQRTRESKTYVNGDLAETIMFLAPIHFEKDGELVAYELDFVTAPETMARTFGTPKAGYTVKQTDSALFIPTTVSEEAPMEIALPGGTLRYVRKGNTMANLTPSEHGLVTDNVEILALESGVKQLETFANELPEQFEYQLEIPSGYKAALSESSQAVQIFDIKTGDLVAELAMPSIIDASQNVYKIANEMTLTQETANAAVVSITRNIPGELVIPQFPVNLQETLTTVSKGNVTIWGMNAATPDRTYGTHKGGGHDDLIMVGYVGAGHGEYYSPVGFYSAVAQANTNFQALLGAGREITDAKFNIFEFTHTNALYPAGGTDFILSRLEKSVGDHSTITFNKYNAANVTMQTNDVKVVSKSWNSPGKPDTFTDFKITEAVTAWYSGAPNHGLQLKTDRTDEGLIFLGHAPENQNLGANWGYIDGRPYITIQHQKAEPIPDDYDINKTTVNLRPFTSWEQEGVLHFQALGFDGIATPNSTVDVEVIDSVSGETVFTQVAAAPTGFRAFPYYESPLYPEIAQAQKYYGLKSNWQATERLSTSKLKKNVVYETRVRAKKLDANGDVVETGEWVDGDTFQLYEATGFDRMYRVMNFYGVTDKVLFMQDNHMGDELLVAKNELFIRNPQKNQNTAYTSPDLSESDKKNIDYALIGRGKHCEFGYEPINLNTGNFYYTNDDMTWFDYDTRNLLTRTYNSMAESSDSIFGRNWSFVWDKQLTFMPDSAGNIDALYQDGTGKRLTFGANADGTFEKPWGEQMALKKVRRGDRLIQEVAGYYDTVEETPTMVDITIGDFEYVLETKEHEIYVFDVDGYLISATENQYGHTTSFVYDENKLLKSVETASGKMFYFTYNDDWYVTKIVGPEGLELHYSYDSRGNLLTFTDSEGFVITYEYKDTASPNLMTRFLDRENGEAIVSNTYDLEGRIISQKDAKGDTVSFKYFANHTEITSFNGEKEYVYFDEAKRTTKYIGKDGIEKVYSYDANNNLLTTDDGMTPSISYTYDASGNIITETRPDGLVKTYTYNGNQPIKVTNFDGTITNFTYDGQDNLLTATYVDGTSIVNSYNSDGQLVAEIDRNGNSKSYTYDSAGNKVTTTDGHGTKTTTFDAFSRILSETDALGYTTSYLRNSRGELLEEQRPTGTKKFSYDADGQKIYEVDANNNPKSYTYDAWSRIIAETDTYGTKQFSYDAHGNMLTETDELGNTTSYTYDDGGRVLKTTHPDGTSETNTYDAKGRQVTTTNTLGLTSHIVYDTVMGRKLKDIDHKGRETSYTYDVFGNILTTTYPDGLVENNRYDINNNLIATIDTRGNETLYTIDANDNEIATSINGEKNTSKELGLDDVILSETDELGGITTTTYNAAKLPEQTVLANGVVQQYRYDGAYQIIEVIDALGHSSTTTYDGNGNVLTETDKLGNTKTMTYTARNQIATETFADGGVIAHVYDAKGQEIKTIDQLGFETATTYDNMGRTVATIDANGNKSQTVYNNLGQKVKDINPKGNTTTYSYTADGLEQAVNLPTGKKTRKFYDAFDRLVEEKDNFGHFSQTTYNAFGDAVATLNEKAEKTKTVYDRYGQVIKTIDSRGNAAETRYDFKGEEVFTKDAKGNSKEVILNTIGQKVSEIEKTSNGVLVTNNTYDPVTGLMLATTRNGATTTFVYDAQENIVSLTNPLGATTDYTYGPTGLETAKTDARGGTVTTVFDKKGQVVKTIDALGNSKLTTYDGNGNIVQTVDELGYTEKTVYDALNQAIKKTNRRGYTTTYTYDIFGNVTNIAYPSGSSSSFIFDKQGREIKRTNAACDDCGTPGTTFLTTYDAFDRKSSTIHPNGYEEYFEYNKFSELMKKTNNLDETIIENTYDRYGRIIEETNALGETTTYDLSSDDKQLKITYADGLFEEHLYDNDGREIEQLDSRGLLTTYSYDAVGNMTTLTMPNLTTGNYTFDVVGNMIEEVDAMGAIRQYEYDLNNNQIQVTDELGNIAITAYNERGEVIKETNENGHSLVKVYDPNGNVTQEIDALAAIKSYGYDETDRLTVIKNRLGFETAYTYDEFNNVITIRDAKNNEVMVTYDEMNQEVKRQNPDGTVEKKVYDIKGNVLEELNGNRQAVSYTYDVLNRNISKSFDNQTYNYTYNMAGQVEQAKNSNGKETTITYSPNYDTEKVVNENGYAVMYEYDLYGRRAAIIYPDGKKTSYEYDDNNRLTAVTTGSEITTYAYDLRGQLLETSLPNGTVSSYTYDSVGNTTSIITKTSDETELTNITYGYDVLNNVIAETSIIEGKIKDKTRSYDAEEQLIASNELIDGLLKMKANNIASKNEIGMTYSYDANGNKVAEEKLVNGKVIGKQFNFDAGNKLQEQTSEFGVKYQYDDVGNVIKKTHATGLIENYTYSSLGELLTIKANNGKTITYTYDALGERINKDEITNIEKSSGSEFLAFIKEETYNEDYDLQLKAQTTTELLTNIKSGMQEYQDVYRDGRTCPTNDGDAPKESQINLNYVNDITLEYTEVLQVNTRNYPAYESFVYGVQRISNTSHKGDVTYYQYDGKGSVIGQQTSKKADALYYKISYNDFGTPNRKLDNEYGYNGESHDYKGTQYLRARYYDTTIGRFNARDTYLGEKEEPISQNRYTYVWNNPSKYVDPSGHIIGLGSLGNIIGNTVAGLANNIAGNKPKPGLWENIGNAIGQAAGNAASQLSDYAAKQAAIEAEKALQNEVDTWTGKSGDIARKVFLDALKNGKSIEEAYKVAYDVKKMCDELPVEQLDPLHALIMNGLPGNDDAYKFFYEIVIVPSNEEQQIYHGNYDDVTYNRYLLFLVQHGTFEQKMENLGLFLQYIALGAMFIIDLVQVVAIMDTGLEYLDMLATLRAMDKNGDGKIDIADDYAGDSASLKFDLQYFAEKSKNKDISTYEEKFIKFEEHYDKHNAEYGGITKQEYFSIANKTIVDSSTQSFYRKRDGATVYYNEKNNDFVVIHLDGKIGTIFKPDLGLTYYLDQFSKNS